MSPAGPLHRGRAGEEYVVEKRKTGIPEIDNSTPTVDQGGGSLSVQSLLGASESSKIRPKPAHGGLSEKPERNVIVVPLADTVANENNVDSTTDGRSAQNCAKSTKGREQTKFEADSTTTLGEDAAVPSTQDKDWPSYLSNPGQVDPHGLVPNLPKYDHIFENVIKLNDDSAVHQKSLRRMICECSTSAEERAQSQVACGDDCLNRMILVECNPSQCPCGEFCTNQAFQRRHYTPVEPFEAGDKGWGLRAVSHIKPGQFIIEYVGEMFSTDEFRRRLVQYKLENNRHHYIMCVAPDHYLDATRRGNLSRFFNHSCSPNLETQKWTVDGSLRVGLFATQHIESGTELTFDYEWHHFGSGMEQPCYCGSSNCRGTLSKTRSAKTAGSIDNDRPDLTDLASQLLPFTNAPLKSRRDVMTFCRLMLRIDQLDYKLILLDCLQRTNDNRCLQLFVAYHGLQLLALWVQSSTDLKLRRSMLATLHALPVSNRTVLRQAGLIEIVESWARSPANGDGPVSTHGKEVMFQAGQLLKTWNGLMEEFRIPFKERLAERKRVEEMLESKQRQRSRKVAGAVAQVAVPVFLAPLQGNALEGSGSSSSSSKSLLPTPLSKEQRRKMFTMMEQMDREEQEALADDDSADTLPMGASSSSSSLRTSASASASASAPASASASASADSSVKTAPLKLPPNWRTATDSDGNVYYYHTTTRQTQWTLPEWTSDPSTTSDGDGTASADTTPVGSKRRPSETAATADGDTGSSHLSDSPRPESSSWFNQQKYEPVSSAQDDEAMLREVKAKLNDDERKILHDFQHHLSKYIVKTLKPYQSDMCKTGRIKTNDDFKHCARRLTHHVLGRELDKRSGVRGLDFTDPIREKTKRYVIEFMKRQGKVYRKPPLKTTAGSVSPVDLPPDYDGDSN